MILMYHKISPDLRSKWWVTPQTFYLQMESLQRMKMVYLDDYIIFNTRQCVITFDDAYKNVLKYAIPILNHFGYPFEVFVIGKTVNDRCPFQSDNDYSDCMDEDDLKAVIQFGGRLQWHSWSHPHSNHLKSNDNYERELIVPQEIKNICPEGFKWFSYPYGEIDNAYKRYVQKYFSGAVAVSNGSITNRYNLKRFPVFEHTQISYLKWFLR